MIIVENKDLPIKEFESLLESAKKVLLVHIGSIESEFGGVEFEELVFEKLLEVSTNTIFENKIEHTGAQSFPDIVVPINKLGIEVKVTKADKWESTGNSIVETTRREDIERIYLLFGKMGGEPDIKFGLYQNYLKEIVVTHSPRYKIDMRISPEESIFSKMKLAYDEFRKNNPIQLAQDYYRSQLQEGEDLWWVEDHSNEEVATSLIIKNYTSLPTEDKQRFLIESCILFPEIFSNSSAKFANVASYLVNKYGAVSSNLRDIFTAGGRVTVNVNSQPLEISQLESKLYENAKGIKNYLTTIELDVLNHYWDDSIQEADRTSLQEKWLEKLVNLSKDGLSLKEVYLSGLNQ